MDLENLFGTDTFTYGFNSLTQDEFCTTVLIMLGVICLCQITKTFSFDRIERLLKKIYSKIKE